MQLCVVLVNWRNTQQTIRCAKSIKLWRALHPTIVIVDNKSMAASRSALEAADVADRVIVSPINRGYGGGNNLGITGSADVAVMLLNSDVQICEATVSQMLGRLDADPDLSILGPVLIEAHGDKARYHVGGRDIARYRHTRVEVDASNLAQLKGYPLIETDYVPGTVFMARRLVFEDVGLLDENYFFSGEIADFCKRAKDKGHKLRIDLQSVSRHETVCGDESLRDTLYAYYSLRNRFLYVRKHYPDKKGRYFGLWALIACAGAAAASVRGRFGRARAILLGLGHGLVGRYGNQNAKFV